VHTRKVRLGDDQHDEDNAGGRENVRRSLSTRYTKKPTSIFVHPAMPVPLRGGRPGNAGMLRIGQAQGNCGHYRSKHRSAAEQLSATNLL
jgi:hypothetical protein